MNILVNSFTSALSTITLDCLEKAARGNWYGCNILSRETNYSVTTIKGAYLEGKPPMAWQYTNSPEAPSHAVWSHVLIYIYLRSVPRTMPPIVGFSPDVTLKRPPVRAIHWKQISKLAEIYHKYHVAMIGRDWPISQQLALFQLILAFIFAYHKWSKNK